MRFVVVPKNGNTRRRTKEKDQPLVNAKVRPAMHIAIARMIVPIFSPSALCMADDSFASLAESSEGLMVSNQADSCLRIASRYFTLVVLMTRSENRSKKLYMISAEIQIAIPTRVKIRDI